MKKLFLLIALVWLCPGWLTAQSLYQQAVDASLEDLDKNGIVSGILYDRVFPAADLRTPNQASSPGHFRQAQAELYWASYERNERLTPAELAEMSSR